MKLQKHSINKQYGATVVDDDGYVYMCRDVDEYIAILTTANESLTVELAKAKKDLQGWSDKRSAHAAAAISGGRI